MGVFTVHDALRAAAIDAGHELGLFEALTSSLSLTDLAERVHVRPTHRLAALVDGLIALGALTRDGDRLARGSIAPRSAEPMSGGWGAIADVIRNDTPLVIDDAEIARRYQRHLVVAGVPAAREVAEMLVARAPLRAIDIGGGAGAYTRALLVAEPGVHVTLVDMPEVVELARAELEEFAERVDFIAGDAREVEFGTSDPERVGDERGAFDVAILANVLHLHSPAACAELCAVAVHAIAPGGLVAIVDLRRGTLEGDMFALNMALYTEGGGVYSVEQVGAWLRAAGLVAIEERTLESAPEMVVILGRRPGQGAVVGGALVGGSSDSGAAV